jgi:hypothetical protein
MPNDPADLEEQLKDVESEIEENFGLKHDAAHVVAEDEVLRGIPAPSSEQVEAERLERVRELEQKKP